MDQGHERPRHLGRVLVLNDISSVNNSCCPLAQKLVGACHNLLVGSLAATAYEHRSTRSYLNHLMILGHIFAWISFDYICTKFDCLTYQGKDFVKITINHVASTFGVCLHHQRLDHQRHTVAVALRFQTANIINALCM